MLMLVPPTAVKVSVVLCGGIGGTGPALCRRLSSSIEREEISEVRASPLLESWDELSNVCNGADTVYLLSALDIPASPADADLRAFTTGVSRVIKCCQESGVESLVFTSSSRVALASSEPGLDHIAGEESLPRAANEGGATLRASGAAGAGGSSCLRTCALRPAAIYGTEEDRPMHQALSGVAWGLNRVAVGPKGVKANMLHVDNLVEAQVLAGAKLVAGARSGAQEGNFGDNPRDPTCSGQAYFVADGQTCNPQTFMDGVFDGLGFPTSKILRLPTRVALCAAWMAEVACQMKLTAAPMCTRADVRSLTDSQPFSDARARKDLGYKPIVDPSTALKNTVDSLKRKGWARHHVPKPSLGYLICNPLGIWLLTLAGFRGPCPAFLGPLASNAEHVGILLLREVSTVRALCLAVYVIHVLEGVYAYRVARQAGHRDTALIWFAQTFFIGFPSIGLVNRLKESSE
ncbi:unnamed protein product [Laminaria digitata]